TIEDSQEPVDSALKGIAHAQATNFNVDIIDTARRRALDKVLREQMSKITKAASTNEALFVVDVMTGQEAVNAAKDVDDVVDYDGVVLSKLDGDTRGGAALAVKYTVGKPIKFISSGETMDTLDVFHPERMAQRILGMGDIVSFV